MKIPVSILGGSLLLAACAGTPPADEAPTLSTKEAAAPAAPAPWKADGPFPQVRYYEIADT